jgi:hypothetical protein
MPMDQLQAAVKGEDLPEKKPKPPLFQRPASRPAS